MTTASTGIAAMPASTVAALELLGRAYADPTQPVEGGAEITAYDEATQRLYVTNADTGAIDVFGIGDPTAPEKLFSFDALPFPADLYGITSVAVSGELVAVAIAANVETNPRSRGYVAFYQKDGTYAGFALVGENPDSVTFTADGTKLLVANEGQIFEGGDPEGSISIVDVTTPGRGKDVLNLTFDEFNGQEDTLRAQGVRTEAGKTASQDFEPEYVTISEDGTTAAVTLQENNAIAFINLATGSITDIAGLGLKDHSLVGNGLDASDRDDGINIVNWPIYSWYMPDGIDSFEVGGQTFWIIANEGDDRSDFNDELARLGDAVADGLVALDPTVFGGPEGIDALLEDAALGRLNILVNEGDTDGDGDLDQINTIGGRSFSVLDSDGNLVFDSGDQLEQLTAAALPDNFNANNEGNGASDLFDGRSDNKGPEPEGVVTGVIDGVTYAFIALERVGGIAMYDLTDPESPAFVKYINSRDFTVDQDSLAAGDLGPEGLAFISAEESPTGRALLAVAHELSGTTAIYAITPPARAAFRLQLLHASDLEGGVEALESAGNFAAIVDKLEDLEANTITLSAGDNYIPGPFFNAAGDQAIFRDAGLFNQVYNALFGLDPATGYAGLREGEGRVDISIMNIIGFDASALGNHEFDAGTGLIGANLAADFRGATLADDRWVGAQFPYLSANLDFSADPSLSGLFTGDILPTTAFLSGPDQSLAGTLVPKIAPATTIEVGGETVGVIGATTQVLASISSPGSTTVIGPQVNDMPALAAILQPLVDQMRADGINKIVLVSHLQQIALETELAGLLDGVDIIVAGGSDTILADGDDALRPGDTAVDSYPRLVDSKTGEPVAIVSTAGEYSYVGRLVVEFDEAGVLLEDSIDAARNGPVAATEANVEALWGSLDAAFAEGSKGELVDRLTDAVSTIVTVQDGVILGETEVFIEGRRELVRTQETTLGNLTADANLWYAEQVTGEDIAFSIKNGGGIRFQIGEVADLGGGVAELLPPQANPASGKEEGQISQLDIVNSLRFNNSLAVVTLTTEDVLAVLEHAVAATEPGATPGQFAQVGGMSFSFDPTQTAGSRIGSVSLIDAAGNPLGELVAGGEVVAAAVGQEWRVVTLGFLADGGDDYPFPSLIEDRVDLLEEGTATGGATFADDGTEQDALAEFLLEFHAPGAGTPFAVEETPAELDTRIVDLSLQAAAVGEPLIA